MTDAEKRELLDSIEATCWDALRSNVHNVHNGAGLRDLLTAIEIIKEMRYDYQPVDDEEDEE